MNNMIQQMQLPAWLDNLIFRELEAKYQPQYSNLTNIDDNHEKALNYLGTYFPRSYAESYCIFTTYFQQHKALFADREELAIFDFGCGTGGEIIGLLTVLNEQFPKLRLVKIIAMDGNIHALRLFEKVTESITENVRFVIENKPSNIVIDDFYDLKILENVLNSKFDIIISFKAICEFVTKDQFEQQNAYEHIAKSLLPKLADDGLMLLVDVTTYNETSQQWLPNMMDQGLKAAGCNIVAKNDGYNQAINISHSHKQNDVSKVAWRMITSKDHKDENVTVFNVGSINTSHSTRRKNGNIRMKTRDPYSRYAGTDAWEDGWSDEMIDDILNGDPENYWNIADI